MIMKNVYSVLMLAAALCLPTVFVHATPFYIRVKSGANQHDYYALPGNEVDGQGRVQYFSKGITLQVNDLVSCYDEGTGAEWALTNIDPYGEYQKFTGETNGIRCNTAGTYDFYMKLQMNNDIMYIGPGEAGSQPTQTPYHMRANNPDVMIQAYYWAHEGNTSTPWTPYGEVYWSSLNQEADTLGKYFDMVWLAPSQATADWTGFLPVDYSDQGKGIGDRHYPWGTETELRTLINHLHTAGAKVIADIVINHAAAQPIPDELMPQGDSWCAFPTYDFGSYGSFSPDWSWIARTDEIYSTGEGGKKWASGNCGTHIDSDYNTLIEDEYTYSKGENRQQTNWSYGEYNTTYSRDFPHRKTEVQQFARAYLKWMKENVGYDGWRYDFGKGFHASHLADYNGYTQPYFSVEEVFDGNVEVHYGLMRDADYTTAFFDFPSKFTCINQGIHQNNYGNCMHTERGGGTPLCVKYPRYAVTFVDNHDTFHEHSNMSGQINVMDETDNHALQACAYILCTPGVPCISYPYWSKYKEAIKKIIMARKNAGVHAESCVGVTSEWEWSGNWGYSSVIQGTNGYLRLCIGPSAVPADPGLAPDNTPYKTAYVGTNVGVYYTGSIPASVETVEEDVAAPSVEKRMENGQLVIIRDGKRYSITGARME